MLVLLKYDRSFSGLSQCWSLDNSLTTENNNGFNQRKGYIFNADGAGWILDRVSLTSIHMCNYQPF